MITIATSLGVVLVNLVFAFIYNKAQSNSLAALLPGSVLTGALLGALLRFGTSAESAVTRDVGSGLLLGSIGSVVLCGAAVFCIVRYMRA